MQIKGKVVKVLPLLSGISGSGKDWQKQDFVIQEIEGNYPKTICLTGFGDIVNKVKNLQVKQVITAHINIESREYNSKWYTNVSVWKIDFEGITNSAPAEVSTQSAKVEEDSENLPF